MKIHWMKQEALIFYVASTFSASSLTSLMDQFENDPTMVVRKLNNRLIILPRCSLDCAKDNHQSESATCRKQVPISLSKN